MHDLCQISLSQGVCHSYVFIFLVHFFFSVGDISIVSVVRIVSNVSIVTSVSSVSSVSIEHVCSIVTYYC